MKEEWEGGTEGGKEGGRGPVQWSVEQGGLDRWTMNLHKGGGLSEAPRVTAWAKESWKFMRRGYVHQAGVVGSLGSAVSSRARPLLPHRPRDQFP